MVAVAQLVRALDCGSRGWGFKSPQPPSSLARRRQTESQRQRAELKTRRTELKTRRTELKTRRTELKTRRTVGFPSAKVRQESTLSPAEIVPQLA
jgi:hypothetical protein